MQATGHRPSVLCVDDDPDLLEAMRDTLRRTYDVRTAPGGVAALELLAKDPQRYAVVISDLRMPGMSGAQFLTAAKTVAPLTVRIVLTGFADAETAARAVNDGQVYRFLMKPCPPDQLGRACAIGVWQHGVLVGQEAQLEQARRGTADALTELLALASPAVFDRGARLRGLAGRLAEALGRDDAWEIEAAAMLMHLGAVALRQDTAVRAMSGEPLTAEDSAAVERVPELTTRVLERLPQLAKVRQIVAARSRRFDSVETQGPVPVGARVLRVAADLEELRAHGADESTALAVMRGRDGVYDPAVLDALGRITHAAASVRVRELRLGELEIGMTLADDVRGPQRRLLVPRGHTVGESLLKHLRNLPRAFVDDLVRVVEP